MPVSVRSSTIPGCLMRCLFHLQSIATASKPHIAALAEKFADPAHTSTNMYFRHGMEGTNTAGATGDIPGATGSKTTSGSLVVNDSALIITQRSALSQGEAVIVRNSEQVKTSGSPKNEHVGAEMVQGYCNSEHVETSESHTLALGIPSHGGCCDFA